MTSPESPSFESLLRASAFLGFTEIHSYVRRHFSAAPEAAAQALRRSAASVSAFDYTAGIALFEIAGTQAPERDRARYQFLLRQLISRFRPYWRTKAKLGRNAIRSELTADQIQCFAMAGLFDDVPDADTVSWWATLASDVHGESALRRVERGKEGEQLSYKHERNRLKPKGLEGKVRWIALDDETAGYDIRSLDEDGKELKLIESKACRGYPLVFFLTRHEWETSIAVTCRYVYQLWHMPTCTLHEFVPQQLAAMVPLDQDEAGRWDVARITLSV